MMLLRDVADSDLDVFFEHWADDDALRMAAFTPADAHDRAAFEARWARQRTTATILAKAIELDGEPVGSIGSWDDDGKREVTYWIGRAHWAKESLRAHSASSSRSRRRGRFMPRPLPTTSARCAFSKSAGSALPDLGARIRTHAEWRSTKSTSSWTPKCGSPAPVPGQAKLGRPVDLSINDECVRGDCHRHVRRERLELDLARCAAGSGRSSRATDRVPPLPPTDTLRRKVSRVLRITAPELWNLPTSTGPTVGASPRRGASVASPSREARDRSDARPRPRSRGVHADRSP